jgi:hypothetical protein
MTHASDAPLTFQCRTCGEWHTGLPDLGFDAPYQYGCLNDEQRRTIARKSSDLCSIDNDDFFVRGVIELPIIGRDAYFGIGVWVSLKKENFERYVELFDSKDPSGNGPYFGWLCNRIAGYPDTLNLKTSVHLRPAPARPRIDLEPTSHPLALQQQKGISLDEVQALVEPTLHPRGGAN